MMLETILESKPPFEHVSAPPPSSLRVRFQTGHGALQDARHAVGSPQRQLSLDATIRRGQNWVRRQFYAQKAETIRIMGASEEPASPG
jgi:hypothetical protein